MRAMCLLVPLAAALAFLPAAAAPPAPAAPADAVDEDDVQDVIFFSATRPVIIRLHVRVDGKPYMAAWEGYVHELFNYLDRNGDGVLSKDEASRAPSVAQFQQMRQFGGARLNFGSPAVTTFFATFGELDADEDEEVSFEEFRAYYRHAGAGGIQISLSPMGRAATADPQTDALFKLLDTNKDGKLSKAELQAAEKVLRPFDEDDNELVSSRELLAGAGNPFGAAAFPAGGVGMMAPPGAGGPDNSPFILLAPDSAANQLTQRLALVDKLIRFYDKDKNGKLDRREISVDAAVFKALDTNGDGELDSVELMKLLRRPPDIEAVIRLGKLAGKESPTDKVAPGGKARDLAYMVRPGTAGTLLVNLGDSQIDLRRTDAVTGASDEQIKMQSEFTKQRYVFLLKQADTRSRGYVDQDDVKKPQFVELQSLFKLADRNGDGKLTEAEIMGWFELQSKALGSYISLSVMENGRGLFEILDANRDGSLGLRELRTAWDRVKDYDRDGSGSITREDIPRQFQLTLGLGQSAAFLVQRGTSQATAVTSRGPIWFRKMDRNGDGDVSLGEFFGTREEFDRIDTDHDGLISVEEAERYDELIRAKK